MSHTPKEITTQHKTKLVNSMKGIFSRL